MTRRRRALAILVLAAAAPACSLLAGLTEEYRVADGAGSEGGAGDTGVDMDGRADGSVPSDGGTDAPADQVVADGGSFCGQQAAGSFDFCEDFELGASSATNAVWTGIQNGLDAGIRVADNAGVGDSSRALEIDSSSSSTSTRNIFLSKKLPANKAVDAYVQYDVEFDVKLLDSTDDYVALGVLNFTNATPEDHGIAAYPSADVIGRLNPRLLGASPAKNAWHHVKITLVRTGAGPMFSRTMTVDSTTVDPGTSVSSTNTSATELRLGIFYTAGAAGRIRARFDNIVARRK